MSVLTLLPVAAALPHWGCALLALRRAARTGNIVDAVINDDEHALLVLVLGDLGLGELRHDGGGVVWWWWIKPTGRKIKICTGLRDGRRRRRKQ